MCGVWEGSFCKVCQERSDRLLILKEPKLPAWVVNDMLYGIVTVNQTTKPTSIHLTKACQVIGLSIGGFPCREE